MEDFFRKWKFIICTAFLMLFTNYFPHLHANPGETSGAALTLKNSGIKVLHFKKLTIEDGLTTSEVSTIVQDKKGFIWISTPAGLNRYDGYTIKQYKSDSYKKNSISSNDVIDLAIDSQGRLWVATNNGLNLYNENEDNFTVYHKHQDNEQSLSSNSISKLFVDSQNRLWIGTRSGFNLYHPETDTFTRYQYDINNPESSFRQGKVRAFNEDNKGRLWIGTASGSKMSHQGLSIFEPESETFTHFDHDPDDPTSLQRGSVMTVLKTSDGKIWVGTSEAGLSKYLPAENAFRHIPIIYENMEEVPKTGIQTEYLNGGIVDLNGNIWLVTDGGGLLRFNPSHDSFIQYTQDVANPAGLNTNVLNSIFEDNVGTLWVGTLTQGINILDPHTERFNHILPKVALEQFNHGSIHSIAELSDGRVLVGTSREGMAIFDPETNSLTQIFEEKTDGYISRRAAGIYLYESNKVLVGSDQGLYTYNIDTGEKSYIPLVEKNSDALLRIAAIFRSRDGIFWLSTAGQGMMSLDLESRQITRYPFAANNNDFDEDSLSSYYPRDIIEDNAGNLWIATIRGLNKFDRKTGTFKHYINNPDQETSLPVNKIYKILPEGEDELWLATNDGLILFNKMTEQFTVYSGSDGLPDNTIYCMTGTKDNLWLATNKGLSRWDRKKRQAKNYYMADGLQSDEFNTGGCSIGKSGTLYFSGINGFNYFKESDIYDDTHLLSLLISEIRLDDKIVHPNSDNKVEIPYNTNVLQLEFRAFDYMSPERTNYWIKLDNFDEDWRSIGNKNNTIYTNLGKGEYTFRVKAVSPVGVESNEVRLLLYKESHPLLSGVAIFIYILLLVLLLTLYTIAHKRQLLYQKDIASRERKLSTELRQLSVHLQSAREEERASVARELHDELAQILVAIKLELSWILSALERQELEKVISRMPEINQSVDSCVKSVRNIATGLRPSILDDMGLISALEWYVNGVSKRANLQLSFNTNCETIEFSKELSINIYRIVQETVTNVIKHSGANKLSISCMQVNSEFLLRIQDNGIGIIKEDMEKMGHWGLIGIRERVATFNGVVNVSAILPTGTSIEVRIPLV